MLKNLNILQIDISLRYGDLQDLANRETAEYCDNSFDFAYDYTFLCALQPDMREQWASTYARLLKPDGVLMTVVFPITGMFFYSLSLSLILHFDICCLTKNTALKSSKQVTLLTHIYYY